MARAAELSEMRPSFTHRSLEVGEGRRSKTTPSHTARANATEKGFFSDDD